MSKVETNSPIHLLQNSISLNEIRPNLIKRTCWKITFIIILAGRIDGLLATSQHVIRDQKPWKGITPPRKALFLQKSSIEPRRIYSKSISFFFYFFRAPRAIWPKRFWKRPIIDMRARSTDWTVRVTVIYLVDTGDLHECKLSLGRGPTDSIHIVRRLPPFNPPPNPLRATGY